MKHKILYLLAAFAAVACSHKDIVRDVDFKISLDESTTYLKGEPVKFLIEGEVDNLVFYSGETGSQYKYKDRFSVPLEQVKSANLELEIQARYGKPGALDLYISKTFDGLSGNDAAADKAKIKAMFDGGMQGWTKLDYTDGPSTKWTSHSFPVNDYLENFSLAIHWHPERDGKSAQRTYWVKGSIALDMEGTAPSKLSVTDLGAVSVMMNDEIADPYVINKGNGSIIFDKPATADVIFQGVGATALAYALDGWVIFTPSSLNKVSNDKGTVIKDLKNYMSSFEHVYKEPGNYTATFIGVNRNYKGSSRDEQEIKFSITEKP